MSHFRLHCLHVLISELDNVFCVYIWSLVIVVLSNIQSGVRRNTQMDPNGTQMDPNGTQMDPNGNQMDPNGT